MERLTCKLLPVAAAILCYSAASPAAIPETLTPGNPVVVSGENLLELDETTGSAVQSIALPDHVGAVRDVVVNQEGKLVVLGAGPAPTIHVFDFSLPEGEREWTSMTAESWQFGDSQSGGELAVLGPVAYVANVSTADGTKGIVGFDLERGDVEWIATGASYQSLVVAPEFMLYGLRSDLPQVDVYAAGRPDADPATHLFRQYQVEEVAQPRAIAVDYASTLHVAGAGGEVARYARHGTHLGTTVANDETGLMDFALNEASHQARVSSSGGVTLVRGSDSFDIEVPGDASRISFTPGYDPSSSTHTLLGLIDRTDGLPAGAEATRVLMPDTMDVTLTDDRTLSVRFSGLENHELDFIIPEPYPLDWGGTHFLTDANNAGAEIVVRGEDCDTQGRFRIEQLELNDDGQPTKLALNFQYQCSGEGVTHEGVIAWQTTRIRPELDLIFMPLLLGAESTSAMAGEVIRLTTPRIFPDDEIVDYQVSQLGGTPVELDIEQRQTFADTRYWPYVEAEFLAPLVTGESETLTFQINLETAEGKHYSANASREIRPRTSPRTRLHWSGLGLDNGLSFMDLAADGLLHALPLSNGIEITAVGSEFGQLGFAAPEGMQLTPGSYTGTTPWTVSDGSGHSFWFADGRRDCSQDATADFTVLRADYTDEQVNELAIDFDVHCDGGTISGELRYQDAGFTLTDADAGADQSVEPGEEVVLDASGSSAPEGEVTGYWWRQVSGPEVELSGADSATATFTAPDAADELLVFQVAVKGDESLENVDRVTVQSGSDEETDDDGDRIPSWLERLRRLLAALGSR